MRILFLGNFGIGWDGSICDEEHIAQALERLGHEVRRLQREESEHTMVSSRDYDFTLVAQWDGYNDIFRNLPKPIVYWAFDYQFDGQAWHEQLVAESNLYLSKRIADSKYENWRWLSQDFAPDFLNVPDHLPEKDIDVLFTGTTLPQSGIRNELLQEIDKKYNLVVHSMTANDWKALGIKDARPPLMDAALPVLYNRAKINISVDWCQENGYWSDRNAQIMACGGFVLSHYTPMMEVHFPIGVAWFKDVPDALEKIAYWLRADEDRAVYAMRGYEYAHEHLMVDHRVRDLITIVENSL